MSVPKNILDIILSNKTSLGDNPALPPELDDKFLVFLVNRYYDDLCKHFDVINIDDLSNELNHALTECKRIERKNKEALEKLCSDLINDIFHIPNDTLSIDMKLVDEVDANQERLVPESSENFSFDDIDDMINLTDEIYKRRLLNSLIIGAAMSYGENVRAYKDELDKIDNRLPSLYRKITIINNLLLFHTKQSLTDKHTDGGKVDVYISSPENPVEIKAEGIIFPILLEETIKGILELAISHGLPKSKEKANFVMSKADFKLAEIWDQRLGLPLWERINESFKKIDEHPIEIGLNFIFMMVSQLEVKEFNHLMQEILGGTKKGANYVKMISDEIHQEKEYDDFNDYMTTQNNDSQYPLNDCEDEFTPDELINDDLCSNIVLDEIEL